MANGQIPEKVPTPAEVLDKTTLDLIQRLHELESAGIAFTELPTFANRREYNMARNFPFRELKDGLEYLVHLPSSTTLTIVEATFEIFSRPVNMLYEYSMSVKNPNYVEKSAE